MISIFCLSAKPEETGGTDKQKTMALRLTGGRLPPPPTPFARGAGYFFWNTLT